MQNRGMKYNLNDYIHTCNFFLAVAIVSLLYTGNLTSPNVVDNLSFNVCSTPLSIGSINK